MRFVLYLVCAAVWLLSPLQSSAQTFETDSLNPVRRDIVRQLLVEHDGDIEALLRVSARADEAVLAWAAYGDPVAIQRARDLGWEPLSDEEIRVDVLSGGDTVARAFRKDWEVVVAFRGSVSWQDWWLTNSQVVLPVLPAEQVTGARRVAQAFVDWAKREHEATGEYVGVRFVGHSLGGRLAMAARLETGREATVFNTSPLSARELQHIAAGAFKYMAPLTSFRSPQDPLQILDANFETIDVGNITRAALLAGLTNFDPTPPSLPGELPYPDMGTAESTSLALKREENIFFEYAHSAQVIAEAMQTVRIAVGQGWLASYLAEPGCRIPRSGNRAERACPPNLPGAPKYNVQATDCHDYLCNKGTRWRALSRRDVYTRIPQALPGAGNAGAKKAGTVAAGSWVSVRQTYSVARRTLVKLKDGAWAFAYNSLPEGYYTVFVSGRMEERGDYDYELAGSHDYDGEIWASVTLPDGSAGVVNFTNGSKWIDEHWESEPMLHSQLARLIEDRYTGPDQSYRRLTAAERAALLNEVDRKIAGGASLAGYGMRHDISMWGAIARSRDVELAKALRTRGWKGCIADAIWSFGASPDAATLRQALAADAGQDCDVNALNSRVGFGIATEQFDLEHKVALARVLVEYGADFSRGSKNEASLYENLSRPSLKTVPNASRLLARLREIKPPAGRVVPPVSASDRKATMIEACVASGDERAACVCYADQFEQSKSADTIFEWITISMTEGDAAAEAFANRLGFGAKARMAGTILSAAITCGLD